MKKYLVLGLSLILGLSISMTCYAGWIYRENVPGWLYLDEATNTIVANTWWWIPNKANGKERAYYFDEYGFLLQQQTTPDNHQVNENGECVINGVVLERDSKITSSAGQSQLFQNQNNTLYANQSSGTKSLTSYIKESQNIEIVQSKSINGKTKNNLIWFKGNGSYLNINTKKYNRVSIVAEKDNGYSSDNTEYEFAIEVNGEEVDNFSFGDNNSLTFEFEYSLNDDVDIILYTSSEESSSLFSSNRGVYITSSKMSKYKEDEDDE